jgi:hypothetical protein
MITANLQTLLLPLDPIEITHRIRLTGSPQDTEQFYDIPVE